MRLQGQQGQRYQPMWDVHCVSQYAQMQGRNKVQCAPPWGQSSIWSFRSMAGGLPYPLSTGCRGVPQTATSLAPAPTVSAWLLCQGYPWRYIPSKDGARVFFAGGCLGWSRAERPSVSWTKMLETLCLQQLKEMLNIKCVQKHAKGHRYQQSPNTEKKAESQRAQRRGLRWNPKESTYARVGRCNQGRGLWWNPKEAPVPEPEVRVRDRKGQRFEQVIKVGGHEKRFS